MDRTSAHLFDIEAVGRPLSERGRAQEGTSSVAQRGPAEQLEQSKQRLARDLVQAKAKLREAKGAMKGGARTAAVAVAAAIAAGLVAAAVRSSIRRRRRGFWRSVWRAL
jgi:hypothetical protein